MLPLHLKTCKAANLNITYSFLNRNDDEMLNSGSEPRCAQSTREKSRERIGVKRSGCLELYFAVVNIEVSNGASHPRRSFANISQRSQIWTPASTFNSIAASQQSRTQAESLNLH